MNGTPRNALAHSVSPYLRQHASNPVNWVQWGPAAFEAARSRDVPLLVSIGYSSCYWCHVMERECFDNEAIARHMNERLVCVKVDREERPDIDDIYMASLLALSDHGGWPLNMFVEPHSLKPIWGGTYFPPIARGEMAAWSDVITSISDAWRLDRAAVLEQCENLAAAARERVHATLDTKPLGSTHVSRALSDLLRMFDGVHGGFGRAPKFPQPVFLELLLDLLPRAGDEPTRLSIERTLRVTLSGMARGGIFDQLAGGFHRYSVDASWTVPHFEKMLYDNAALARIYARAAVVLTDPVNEAWWRDVARRTYAYVLRSMRGDHGAFFSAIDAEVNGREGLNYLWSEVEIRSVLSESEAALACPVFGVSSGPNFRDPHAPGEPMTNVLILRASPAELAASVGVSEVEFTTRLAEIASKMLLVRDARPQPRIDDKVIASWNGLMIESLATGGVLLGDSGLVDAAERAATFVRDNMVNADGSLRRVWLDGRSSGAPVLDDAAHVIRALLALHRAGRGGGTYRADAERVADAAIRLHTDEQGDLVDSPSTTTDVFMRTLGVTDGAMAGGAASMLHALLDLVDAGSDRFIVTAAALLTRMSGSIDAMPVSCAEGVRGLLRMLVSGIAADHPPDLADAVPSSADADTGVVILADRERVAVTPAVPGLVRLAVEIAPGTHVIAGMQTADAPRGLTPMRVGILGGTGLSVYADYPEGTMLSIGELGSIGAHTSRIEFDVVIEVTGDVTGRPLLIVDYQACTDHACLAPVRVELDVAIDVSSDTTP